MKSAISIVVLTLLFFVSLVSTLPCAISYQRATTYQIQAGLIVIVRTSEPPPPSVPPLPSVPIHLVAIAIALVLAVIIVAWRIRR